MGTLGNANDLYDCKQDKHNVQGNSSFVPIKIGKDHGPGSPERNVAPPTPTPSMPREYMLLEVRPGGGM